MALQDPLDGAQGGNFSDPLAFQFPLDGLRTDARESRSAGSMGFQRVSEQKHLLDHGRWGLSPDTVRDPALVFEPGFALFPKTTQPFRKPRTESPHLPKNRFKAFSLLIQLNGINAELMLCFLLHHPLSPSNWFGRNIGDSSQNRSRCYGGNSVLDVMAVTR
jgi:hypothetical protein